MKYSLLIVKLVVGLCIFFNASTLTHASCKKDHNRCHKSHHHHKGKCCKSESESENRVKVKVRTGSIRITDTNAEAQAQTSNQNVNVSQLINEAISQIAGCCNSSCNTNSTTPTSALTFGGWFNNGTFTQTLAAAGNETLNFVNPELTTFQGIVNVGGTFVFTQDGLYKIDVAVVASNEPPSTAAVTTDVFEFQLVLNGSPVPGGVLEVQPRTPVEATSLNGVSVLKEIKAGSLLALVYVGSCTGNNPCTSSSKNVTVGPSQSPHGISAFITITQLH